MKKHLPPPTKYGQTGPVQAQPAPGFRTVIFTPPPRPVAPAPMVHAKVGQPASRWSLLQAKPMVGRHVIQCVDVSPKPKIHNGNWRKFKDPNVPHFAFILAFQIGEIEKLIAAWPKSGPKISSTWLSAFGDLKRAFDGTNVTSETTAAYNAFVELGFAPVRARLVGEDEADQIWADMQDQYSRWDGTLTNRGAWWGSSGPGIVAGAKSVPSHVIDILRMKVSTSWNYQDSHSGGVSFHRKKAGKDDFIYHMLPP